MRFDRIPSQAFHDQTAGCSFTEDEQTVLDFRRKNVSVVSIACQMHVSESTVNRRIKSIKEKMASELY